MSTFARYVTLTPEQRRHVGYPEPVPLGTARPRLFKSHRFEVNYPDGSTGHATYERLAPFAHRFRFFDCDKRELPRQYWNKGLVGGQCAHAVEGLGQDLVTTVFEEAIERERREFFCRVSHPTNGRLIEPKRYQLRAGRARKYAGKYALCVQIGQKLVPCSRLFDTLAAANTAWLESPKDDVYVACCSLLDRRWMLPRYNPLYASGHPRKVWDHD